MNLAGQLDGLNLSVLLGLVGSVSELPYQGQAPLRPHWSLSHRFGDTGGLKMVDVTHKSDASLHPHWSLRRPNRSLLTVEKVKRFPANIAMYSV